MEQKEIVIDNPFKFDVKTKLHFIKKDIHCPECGKQTVWEMQEDDDFYLGKANVCTGCKKEFTIQIEDIPSDGIEKFLEEYRKPAIQEYLVGGLTGKKRGSISEYSSTTVKAESEEKAIEFAETILQMKNVKVLETLSKKEDKNEET